jgi:hypothetical protein
LVAFTDELIIPYFQKNFKKCEKPFGSQSNQLENDNLSQSSDLGYERSNGNAVRYRFLATKAFDCQLFIRKKLK